MKLPSFQFYPGDWRKDPGIQSLTFHDRGVWFEILLIMHESSERGKLLLNGIPMPDEMLARLLGLDKQILTNTLTTLLTYGVASRDPESGALVSRRMVRDEEIRKTRSECGKLGGNPGLLKQNQTTADKQKPTPSASSSVSTSSNTPIVPKGTEIEFESVRELFNQKCPLLPKAEMLTPKRKAAIRSRWHENGGITGFEKVFEIVNRSQLLTGNNERGWRASFDWILNPSNWAKIIEGNYSTNKPTQHEVKL